MMHLKQINNFVRLTLFIAFVMILIHEIPPLVIDTHGKCHSVPVSTESHESDHSDGCDASCPCVIHVLEISLGFSQSQNNNLTVTSSIRLKKDLIPESIIQKSIYRPPKA